MDPKQGWVALLETRLEKHKRPYKVINMSTSGDTTINGYSKLKLYFKSKQASIVIIQLGSNDALRGLALSQTQINLQKMITLCKTHEAKVMLVTNRLPPNYGQVFIKRYSEIFAALAKQNKIGFVQTMLKGVPENKAWMQADGLHPNHLAQATILNNIWPKLNALLQD